MPASPWACGPLGKGKVITMGTAMPKRSPTAGRNCSNGAASPCPPLPPPPAAGCEHFVSNNGLYDVYVVWAEQIKEPGAVTLTIPGTQATMVNLLSGATVAGTVADGKVKFDGLNFEPLETYAFLAPRSAILGAPLAWLKLQRDWWKGTKKPAPAPELQPWRNTFSLDADWAFEPIPAQLPDDRFARRSRRR
jgi:hypothetical protein